LIAVALSTLKPTVIGVRPPWGNDMLNGFFFLAALLCFFSCFFH